MTFPLIHTLVVILMGIGLAFSAGLFWANNKKGTALFLITLVIAALVLRVATVLVTVGPQLQGPV